MFIKSNKKSNKKLNKYEKKIFDIEQNHRIKVKFNIQELEEFQKKFAQYKLVCMILMDDPNYYKLVKYILLDQNVEYSLYQMNETIWINEHYNYIMDIRTIENDIVILLDDALNFNIISKIQYELVRRIIPTIINIFESDYVLSEIYNKTCILNISNKKQIEYYFNIIEIILLKMMFCNNISNLSYKNLLNNNNYFDSINKIKKLLEINVF